MKQPVNLRKFIRLFRKTKPIYRLIFFIILFLIFILIIPAVLKYASGPGKPGDAKFYFTATNSTISVGQNFNVELRIKTGRNAINAAGTTIKYPNKYLEVVKMTTDQSFCTFYTENAFDNNRGEINLSCGTPNPGFVGDTPFVKLTMRAKNFGNIKLELSKDSSILANDGEGTELSNSHPALELKINQL